MEILLFCMLIGLIPAHIARKKGRGAFGWWVYGAALFIIALPHALLLEETVVLNPSTGMKRCPYCAESIRKEAYVCRYCNRDLQVVLPPDIAAKERVRLEEIKEDEREAQESASNKRLGYGVLLGIGVVGVILLAAQTPNKQHANTQPPTEVRPSPASSSEDNAHAFIVKYGTPNIDDSTQNDNPRPPIVTRWLIYKKANVRVWFVPRAKITESPPYDSWVFFKFQDVKTGKALSNEEAERRLARR